MRQASSEDDWGNHLEPSGRDVISWAEDSLLVVWEGGKPDMLFGGAHFVWRSYRPGPWVLARRMQGDALKGGAGTAYGARSR